MKHSAVDLRNALRVNIPNLEWSVTGVNAQGYHGINNYRKVLDAIFAFEEFGLFKNQIDKLKQTTLMADSANEKRFHPNEVPVINSILDNVKQNAMDLLDIFDRTLPEPNEYSVNIRFPNVKDFNDLSTYARHFHLALTQVIHLGDIDGETVIESVENGSIWVNVFVKTPAALALIASLTWSAAVVCKKMQEVRLMEEQIHAMTLKNETIKDLQEGHKTMIKKIVELESAHLNDEHLQTSDPEEINRIINSVEILSELIFKGAEVQPALNAPEEVSNLFPDPKNISNIQSKVKQITN